MLHIIIIGAPGSGKGTHSAKIADNYGLIHLSTGDILREEVELHTTLGNIVKNFIDSGHLVPDDIMIREFFINTMKYEDAKGILYDGYPRTIFQAENLDEVLKSRNREISLVLSLEVKEDELYKRILHRAEKSNRNDDTIEVIKNRLAIFHKQTVPLLNYYDKQKKLFPIDGNATEEVVYKRISTVVDDYIKNNF